MELYNVNQFQSGKNTGQSFETTFYMRIRYSNIYVVLHGSNSYRPEIIPHSGFKNGQGHCLITCFPSCIA